MKGSKGLRCQLVGEEKVLVFLFSKMREGLTCYYAGGNDLAESENGWYRNWNVGVKHWSRQRGWDLEPVWRVWF